MILAASSEVFVMPAYAGIQILDSGFRLPAAGMAGMTTQASGY
jgi:hypothetical protein